MATGTTANFSDQTIWTGDNLPIMRGMNSETVDLIYLDPPFNSNANYAAPIGSKAAGSAFSDTWGLSNIDQSWCDLIQFKHPGLWHFLESVRMTHSKSMMSYLIYMAPRLMEMHRLLKPSGSIFLHCDRYANYFLRSLLDVLFGRTKFRAEIIWERAGGRAKGSQHKSKKLGVDTDTIFHYVKTNNYTWHPPSLPLSEDELQKKFPLVDVHGKRYNTGTPIFRSPSQGERPNLCYEYDSPHGPVSNPHPSGWRVSKQELAEMDKRGEIVWRQGKPPQRKSYLDDYAGKPLGTLWDDIPNLTAQNKEYLGYPTQKPVALVERIILAASNPGDMVMDPFCGCATACIAAERLNREWVGIDISFEAAKLVKRRLALESPLTTHNLVHRKGPPGMPKRTDMGKLASPKTEKNKKMLFGQQKGICNGCLDTVDYRRLTFDHIISLHDNGADHIDNLQLLCNSCNSIKGQKSQEYLKMKLNQAGLV